MIYETDYFDGPLINVEVEGEIHTRPTAYGMLDFMTRRRVAPA